MNGHIFFISGPSGVGKGTVIDALRRYSDFVFPPSATTRAIRPGEVDGETYIYLSDQEFDQYIADGRFLEYATVHGGARYGTLKEKILTPAQNGQIVIREFDVQGFAAASRALPRELFTGIFLAPADSPEIIKERIKTRAPISEKELESRMKSLQSEIAQQNLYDFVLYSHNGETERLYHDVDTIICGRLAKNND